MARAYIVLVRNDLDDNLLQTLDLKPNESLRNFPYAPPGQTHYVSHYLLDGVNAAVAVTGAGPITTVGDTYGLSAYLIDHVEGLGVSGALLALTAAEAAAASAGIEAAAAAGDPLTAAGLAAAMGGGISVDNTAQAGAATTITLAVADNQADDYYNGWTVEITGGTGVLGEVRTITDYATGTDVATVGSAWSTNPDVTTTYTLVPPVGLTAGNSTGSVEDVLRILSGDRWKLPTGSTVEDGGNLFETAVAGFFVTRPNVEGPLSVRSADGFPIRGRSAFGAPVVPLSVPVQTGLEDVNFNDIRAIFDTGLLHKSAGIGTLSEMKATTFSFLNPDFTYGAGASALTLDGTTEIGVDGAARAVVVYDAAGNVI